MKFLAGTLFFLSAATANPSWVEVPAGDYSPLFVPSRADPKGLLDLRQNSDRPKISEKIRVSVAAFQIAKSPVTNEDFQKFVKVRPEWQKRKAVELFADSRYLEHWNASGSTKKLLRKPVTNVSWFAAKSYCQSLGARLPTTDEWEYIASLDNPEKRDKAILDWYAKPAGSTPTFQENSFVGVFGIQDMYGKIWEWTSDFNSSMVTGESREDTSLSRSMFCGAGSIGATKPEEYATFMRFAFRSSLKGNYDSPILGFRCAKNLPKENL